MLQEAIDLQQNAVAALVDKAATQRTVTFRAPTGSGKTRMMADLMHRTLASQPDVVFLVSSLSKGGLAEQNYRVFRQCADSGLFPLLNPYLISSQSGDEERLFIPDGYNVYVLPRDLYKDKSRLKDGGALVSFLDRMTHNLFSHGLYKRIWLVKDECHQATNNLDGLNGYFDKVFNFSATPKLSRGQMPDVEISDSDAVAARLIKRVAWGADEETVEDAIRKFEQVKEQYTNLLGVNPCLIIQISNKGKAEEEWAAIERTLNRTEHQHLKWMSIADKRELCRTNDKVGRLKVERWKDYARMNAIDVIVFKMVVSEGWDIPRACMLYQVRDSKSRQLDEQVMGRVRRNPRLADFETLTDEARRLATTAWVWGVAPKEAMRSRQVRLFGDADDIPSAIRVRTTRLKPLAERQSFDVAQLVEEASRHDVAHTGIFDLYARLQRCENEVRDLCYRYADGNVQRWWRCCEHLDDVRRAHSSHICRYDESMVANEATVSFPTASVYVDNEHYQNIGDWVWRRKDGSDKFSFDSEAEREWASILKDLSHTHATAAAVGRKNPLYGKLRTDNSPEPYRLTDECKYLWGKNYMHNSDIKFEYYLHGVHASYPDFVMKDRAGRIHLFEVKSVNRSAGATFDADQYKEKVLSLKECYRHCSLLTGQLFYLPVLCGDEWQITRLADGKELTMSRSEFEKSLKV